MLKSRMKDKSDYLRFGLLPGLAPVPNLVPVVVVVVVVFVVPVPFVVSGVLPLFLSVKGVFSFFDIINTLCLCGPIS